MARSTPWLLLTLAGLVSCQSASIPLAPPSPGSGATVSPGMAVPESIAAVFAVAIDPVTLTSTVTPEFARAAQNQPPQAISYDLDIQRFLAPGTFRVSGLHEDADNDIVVEFSHAHPFPAPNFSLPISGTNRADLGYTGRLLILADSNTSNFFGNTIRLDPDLVKGADGYCATGDLLATSPLQNNTFPYVLLADDGEDNRVGVSNNANPAGSYDPLQGGWQQSNIDAGWTGHDFVHGGQTITNNFTLRSAEITGGPFIFRVALLIKYTDPRGMGGKTRRFPVVPADPLAFAYRAPFADLDASKIIMATNPLTLDASPGAMIPITFATRDWDATAAEAGDANLADENDVSLIQPGASGTPVAECDAPAFSAALFSILPGGAATGLPGDEIPYTGTLTNDLGTAAPGSHPICLRLIDPEDGDAAASTYHKGVDPLTLQADPARALAVRTYQIVHVVVTQATPPPVIDSVSPTGTVGIEGALVTFSALTSGGTPTNWNWDFYGGATPNTSTMPAPQVTIGPAGTYALASVTASNAGGASPPFVFSFTVDAAGAPPTWQVHGVASAKDQYQALTVLNGKLSLALATNSGTADLRFAQATVATPTSSAQWTIHDVDTPNETGYTPSAVVQPSGFIAVAFRDWTQKDLRVARALVAAPTTPGDWQVHAADTIGDVGHYTSITVSNGLLAVAHTDFGFPNRPRISRALSATPTSAADWLSYQLEAGGGGYTPSLIDFNGTLSNFYAVGNTLRYARALNAAPLNSSDWVLSDVDSDTTGCDWPSATIHGGMLAVAYCPRGMGDLKVALATVLTPAGTGDWQAHLIETPGDTGFFPSMMTLGGRLAISYMDFGPKDFKVARAMVATPTSAADWQIATVDSVGVVGGTTRLVDLNGVLAASYYDSSGGQVKVAIASNGW